jgi:hypothetical protein
VARTGRHLQPRRDLVLLECSHPALTGARRKPYYCEGILRSARSRSLAGPKPSRPVVPFVHHAPPSIYFRMQRGEIDRSFVPSTQKMPYHQIRCQSAKNVTKEDKSNGPIGPHFILHIIRYHSHHVPCSISKALRHFLGQRKTQHRQNFLGSNARTADSIETFPPIPTAVDFCCGLALFL